MVAFRKLFPEALTSLLVIYLAETFTKVCLFLISRVVYDLSVRRGLFQRYTYHIGSHLSTFTDLCIGQIEASTSPPGIWLFENYCSNSPLPGPKCPLNAPHEGPFRWSNAPIPGTFHRHINDGRTAETSFSGLRLWNKIFINTANDPHSI